MVTKQRWKEAQSYEKSFWANAAKNIDSGGPDLSWYDWKAKNCMEKLSTAFPDEPLNISESKVLEVGSGPVGIVAYLEAETKKAIDPLADFYGSQNSLSEHRDNTVEYIQGQAEELPFDNDYFDLLVIDNVIDHVHNADQVMTEIHRVLKPESVLYFTVNLHPPFGAFKHEILSKLKIDKGHPHTFTIKKIQNFLASHGFSIKYEEWEDYEKCRQDDLNSDSRKARIKGFTGLSEFLYTSVCLKV